MHGTIDQMITVPHAEVLVRELGGEDAGVKRRVWEGRGHVLMWEEREEFRQIVEELVQRTAA